MWFQLMLYYSCIFLWSCCHPTVASLVHCQRKYSQDTILPKLPISSQLAPLWLRMLSQITFRSNVLYDPLYWLKERLLKLWILLKVGCLYNNRPHTIPPVFDLMTRLHQKCILRWCFLRYTRHFICMISSLFKIGCASVYSRMSWLVTVLSAMLDQMLQLVSVGAYKPGLPL
jgi:hypothetical protein